MVRKIPDLHRLVEINYKEIFQVQGMATERMILEDNWLSAKLGQAKALHRKDFNFQGRSVGQGNLCNLARLISLL